MSKYYISNRKTHILLLIGSLNIGGAERQLVELVRNIDKLHLKITVVIFYNEGEFMDGIRGIPNTNLLCMNKSGRWDFFHLIYNLRKTLKNINPV